MARLLFTVTSLTTGTVGCAVAIAIFRAQTTEAFLVLPSLSDLAAYLLALFGLVALALALEFGSAPVAARGGRAARAVRASLRRRVRHQRTRAEIERVETGLTLSFCTLLLGLALWVSNPKAILATASVIGLWLAVRALWSLGRLLSYSLRASTLIGFLAGMAAGALLG